ncbi:unnamed protein product [Angiostrongylus costaricensis]|uniref:Tail fiber protein n=1 Tax=Angiostrongylus costaricensis TaxID=334426 RepID=A0A0R3PBK1_ANGCS|nr:unnamed protein product [Angiostrongylus costaricensis]
MFAGPDATIVTKPTFKFSFYPPIQWTYYTPPPPAGIQPEQAAVYPEQQASLNDAHRVMKNDIDAAILKSLNKIGVVARGTTWQTSGYTPQNCLIRTNNGQQGWRAVGTCVPQIGAVTTIRTVVDSDTGTDNAKNGLLRVTTPLLVTRSQWKYLASEVYNQLSVYSKVYFTSPIELQ